MKNGLIWTITLSGGLFLASDPMSYSFAKEELIYVNCGGGDYFPNDKVTYDSFFDREISLEEFCGKKTVEQLYGMNSKNFENTYGFSVDSPNNWARVMKDK